MEQQQEEYRYKYMEVWKEGLAFSSVIISCTEAMAPHVKGRGVLEKIEQTAISIPAKIASGRAMGLSTDYLKALQQVEGNLHKSLSYLHLMRIQKWISATDLDRLERQGTQLARKMKSLVCIIQMLLKIEINYLMGLTRQPMEKKFIDLICYVLELEDRTLELPDRFDSFAEWDSLAQLTLIAELDEQFGIAIEGTELRSMETLEDLYLRIQKETPND